MTTVSFRTDEEMVKELDRLAKIMQSDRATIIRRILGKGIKKEKIELAIKLYQEGESLGKACEKAQVSIWEVIDEMEKRGITKRIDIEELKDIIIKTLAKDAPELSEKITKL